MHRDLHSALSSFRQMLQEYLDLLLSRHGNFNQQRETIRPMSRSYWQLCMPSGRGDTTWMDPTLSCIQIMQPSAIFQHNQNSPAARLDGWSYFRNMTSTSSTNAEPTT